MKTITKALAGTIAAGAMVIGSATPALAQSRDRGIDAGDVVAGALIIGGIAAVAAATSNDRDRDYRDRDYRDRDYRDRDYRDRDYGDYRDRNWDGRGTGWYDYNNGRGYYGRRNNPERAVERCVRAAEQEASRYGGGRANVTRIRDIDRERGGFEITGTIAVSQRWNNGRSWGGNRNRYDTARFYCDFRRGQVVDIDFDGLRRR